MRSVHSAASLDDVSIHQDISGWQSLCLTQGRLRKPVSPPPSQEHESYLVSSYLTHCLWGVSAKTGPAQHRAVPILLKTTRHQPHLLPSRDIHMLQWQRRCACLLSPRCHYCCHKNWGLWRHLRLQWQELCHWLKYHGQRRGVSVCLSSAFSSLYLPPHLWRSPLTSIINQDT